MKKLLLSVITLGLMFLATGCNKNEEGGDVLSQIQKRGKLIVGVKYDTKPFGYLESNQILAGFDVDLAKYIAKELLGDEAKIEFKQVTPSSRILALNSGEVDMVIATMTVTPQRKEVVDFSIPYYAAGQAILVPNSSKITSISDLNGKRVIIVFGTTSEKNLRLRVPDANIIGFRTYTGAYTALKQGRADAMTSDDSILMGFALADNSVKMLPQRYTKEPYAVAFKKGASSTRLLERVNDIISDMQRSGQLNQIKAKWIKF